MRRGNGTVVAGAALAHAATAVVLLHGRGADAESMLGLAETLALPNVAYLAPQAPDGSWYPYSFLAPLAANEPHLSRALDQVGGLVDEIRAQGIQAERIALVGFSQGGCLALEFAARNAIGLGAVAGLSAGLIGPPGTPRDYPGHRNGLRVLLGCSDVDGHIPLARVHETEHVLRGLGADVDARIYPGMGHTINADEIQALRSLLAPRPDTGTVTEQTLNRRTA
ncbi:MAG: phospholipase [Hyphomicrobiales bacterium]|nr:MAG: phospholipase [Hyphomicrobiales bacterium]